MTKALPDSTWRSLDDLPTLLNLAADRLWEAADAAGTDSPLYSLGLGTFLAAWHAAEVLEPGRETLATELVVADVDPIALLTTAEQLARGLDPAMAGASRLTVEVADLLSEARANGA